MSGTNPPVYREETVHFSNGSDSLSGLLCLPGGTGPYPAVAFVAGSGPAGRDGYSSLPPIWHAFARHGIASLAWDKPGVGESSGDWRLQTNEARAREAVEAIKLLQHHPAVAAGQVGVWGISQAGWVIPVMCSMYAHIAFAIAVSVPVGTGAQQELYRVAHSLPADGYSPDQTEKALQFTRVRLQLMEQGTRYDRIAALQREVRQEPWFREVGELDEASYRFLQSNAFFSPQALLPAIRCPVLAVFGQRDTLIDVSESVEVLDRVLRAAGNSDVTIRVFPDTDHLIFRSKTGGMRELDDSLVRASTKPYPPEYLETMARWIRERRDSRRPE